MMSWSSKRRFMYGGTFVLVVVLFISYIFLHSFYHAPSCTDGIQNGDELGVDCGGSCQVLCTSDTLTPVVLWSKVFNVSGDVYTAVAYVENPNLNSKNDDASYSFKIYDEHNHVIALREGDTSIPKNKKFTVFETGFVLKNSKPASADFEFTSFSPWKKDMIEEPSLTIDHGLLQFATTTPRVEGTITNTSTIDVGRIEVTAFVIDDNDNVVATSQTFIDSLPKKAMEPFVFTWPKPITASVINIMYRIL